MFPLPPPAVPKLCRFSEMPVAETADAFVVVGEAVTALTQKGDPYVKLTVRDKARAATTFVWKDRPAFEPAGKVRPGDVIKIRGRFVPDERWGSKLELDNLRPADPARDAKDYSPTDLFETTRFDVGNMWLELLAIIEEHVRDPGVRLVTAEVLRRNEPAFRSAPAAAQNHHAYIGGLLEHTLSVARLCVHLADKYIEYYRPAGVAVDKDLIIAGGILHDVGKVAELDIRPGVGEYTTVGKLVGHILIGRDMLREAAAAVPQLDARRLMLLEHIIISHQGRKEWSSPIEPKTLEALIVHYADDIDAKVNTFVEAIGGDAGGGEFTGRRNLFGRELYRG